MTNTAYQFTIAYGGEQGSGNNSTCFLSLDLTNTSLLFCALEGLRGSITSQIAVKMSMDAVLEKAFQVAASPRAEFPLATEVVREAVKDANNQVYQYGHRMGRGGAMGALGAVACFAANRFSMARLGQYSGFIYRAGKIAPLFEPKANAPAERPGEVARYLGANAQVLVDLASVEALSEDIFIFSSFSFPDESFSKLQTALEAKIGIQKKGEQVLAVGKEFNLAVAERANIVSLLQLQRPTILLKNVVGE